MLPSSPPPPAAVRFRRLRRILSWADNALLVVVLAAGGAWGYEQVTGDRLLADDPPAVRQLPPSPPPSAGTEAEADTLGLLATLEVKGRAPMTGYDRKLFGVGALDFDQNGCDYRNDTLRRDLDSMDLRPGPHVCVVERGSMVDPYTGVEVGFVRNVRPYEIEIDHVVALGDAWQKGAQQWSPDQRLRFANDPRNLLATSRSANQRKKHGDAATWLPPNQAFRCTYVARQVEVKAAYGLAVTAAERDAMHGVLRSCG